MIKILYIDDEENNLIAFKASFRRSYNVLTAISTAVARDILKTQNAESSTEPVNIIVSDQRMPEEFGTAFFEWCKEHYPDPIRILLTGYADIQAVIDCINRGEVYRYVTKPWDAEELKSVLESAYELYALRKENKELTEKLLQANEQLEFLLRQKLLS